MQSAIEMRTRPRNPPTVISIEKVVLVAALITLVALVLRDPLTLREVVISSAEDSANHSTYTFDDRGNGGASVATAGSANTLAWACQLRDAYEYRY